MDARRFSLILGLCLAPVAALSAQESGNASIKADLEALKAQLKAQEQKIDRLTQEVAKLTDAVRAGAEAQADTAPKAAPAAAAPVEQATAGVDNPTPADQAGGKTHTVAKGETLTQIAKQYGVTVDDIQQLNKIGDAKKLQAGQTIKIPTPAGQ
jgi:LysM repeat protein